MPKKKLFTGISNEVSVRRKILVPLSLTFVVLICSFIYGGYKIRGQQVLSEIHHKYSGVQNLFSELLDYQAELMRVAAVCISRNETLQDIYLSGDRSRLQRFSEPRLEKMFERYGITHFYFHDLRGINFLRVHKANSYGDQIERHVMHRAMATGDVAFGLELGPLGTFTYRTVLPWRTDDGLIGYIELGQEIDYLLRKLKAITQVDYLVTIDKKLLNRDQWESGMKMLGRTAGWDLLPDRAIIDQSIPGIQNFANVERFFYDPTLSEGFAEAKINNRLYRFKGFPLLDAAARNVGDFVVLNDASKEQAGFSDFVLRIALISLVLCSAIFAFTFAILGRMDKRLSATRRELYGQIDTVTTMNTLLETEVSERKRAEADLTKLNESLEERVSIRTAELQNLNCELEQAYQDLKAKHATILHQDKMACVGQLAAGVAHDINNPIGFVSNNLSELEDYAGGLCTFISAQEESLKGLDTEGAELKRLQELRIALHIDAILGDIDELISESQEGTDRVIKIVQNLRTFSRIDDNDYERADLKDCLDSTINITWNELRYKAEVVRDYGNIPAIHCYPGQLNQVFMNLLINAAQAIEGFGVITVRTWSEPDHVFISIADTGSGISESELQRVFEPFFTTKEVGKGTGLGLSITYDIIKQHGGTIKVASEIGKGTTFTIRLPLEVANG